MVKSGSLVGVIPCTEEEVLDHRHRGEDLPFFGYEGKSFLEEIVRVHAENIFTIKGNRSGGLLVESYDRLNRGSLTGTVWPDHGDQFAFVDMNDEIPDDLQIPVKDIKP